jgi:hypothetical protein
MIIWFWHLIPFWRLNNYKLSSKAKISHIQAEFTSPILTALRNNAISRRVNSDSNYHTRFLPAGGGRKPAAENYIPSLPRHWGFLKSTALAWHSTATTGQVCAALHCGEITGWTWCFHQIWRTILLFTEGSVVQLADYY